VARLAAKRRTGADSLGRYITARGLSMARLLNMAWVHFWLAWYFQLRRPQ